VNQLVTNVCASSGRIPEAQAETATIHESVGDAAAFQFAEIYAQWGDVLNAPSVGDSVSLGDPGAAGFKRPA
jgi:hypothetical protein